MIKFQLINVDTKEILYTINNQNELRNLIEIRNRLNNDCKAEKYIIKMITV